MVRQQSNYWGFGIVKHALRVGLILAVLASMCLAASAAPQADAFAALENAQPPLVRLEGTLKAKGPDKWVVGDSQILLGHPIEIIEKRGLAQVGAWVVVWANMPSEGVLEAQIIYVDTPAGEPGPPMEISGILTKILPGWWRIESAAIQVPDNIALDDAKVGDLVWVSAEQRGDFLYALAVKLLSDNTDETFVEFEGTLVEMGDSKWIVEKQPVALAPGVDIIGEPVIGAHVEVRATLGNGGIPLAQTIRVMSPDSETSLGAFVAAIAPADGDQAVWDAVLFPPTAWANPIQATIRVDRNTLVDESRGVTGSGTWVEIRALSLGDNDFEADHIRIEQPVRVTISGQAVAVTAQSENGASATGAGGTWLNVNGRPVWLAAGSAASAGAASAADDGEIAVHGLLLGNGVIWAEQVEAGTR